jgi:hypothetical protein
MLGRIGNSQICQSEIRTMSVNEDRYARNELQDMQKGMECLFEFKDKLSKLHPNVLECMENILQRQRY